MPDHSHPNYDDDAIVNVETHHEKSDVDVKALLWFTVIFIVFAIVTHFALWILFKFYVRLERRPDQNAPALTAMQRPSEAPIPATEPRLQPFPAKEKSGEVPPPYSVTPVSDMEQMLDQQNKVLNNYGWVDQQKGVVHIPIEEAKKRVLQQLGGAPVSSQAPAAAVDSGAPQSTAPAGGPR